MPSPDVDWVSDTECGVIRRKHILKLLVIGDGGVGKTTLIHRYLTGEYLDQRMTVGAGFATRNIQINGVTITLSIWDFAGEERFRFILPRYCIGTHGAILAFDLSRPTTFFHLDDWLEIIREKTDNIPILLIGTKCDIVVEIQETAEEYVANRTLSGYMETSSKENVNVNEAFELIAHLMWTRAYEKYQSLNSGR